MSRFALLLLIFLPLSRVKAQTPAIDSLKQLYNFSETTKQELNTLFLICDQRYSLNPDTLFRYATLAYNLSKEKSDQNAISLSEYYLANYLLKKGNIDSALNICNQNIKKLTNTNSIKVLHDFKSCRATIFIKKNLYKEAMNEFYHILNEAELTKDTSLLLTGKNGIGWVYMELDQNRNALDWFFKALELSGSGKYDEYLLYIYSNIAANYNSLFKNDSAEYFVSKAILLARKFQNLSALANSLNIQADIFTDNKRTMEAEKSLTEALEIRKQVGEPFYIVSDMMQLAKFYAKTGQPQKGISLSKEGIAMANKYNLSSKLMILYDALAENYKAAGNKSDYAATLVQIIALKDSLYAKNSAEAFAEIQGKYNVQKRENVIIKQKLDLVNRNYLLYGSLLLLLFGVTISALLFKNYRRKQRMKIKMMQQEEQERSYIAVNNAEANERKRIAADLHDNMGAYATAIIANVDEVVQQKTSLNPIALANLKNNASEIMSHLRDTIWALNKERISITGVSDRFKTYIHKTTTAYPEVSIEIVENITHDLSLSPVQALNLFRILQEACTNSLKHSSGNKIKVSISSDKSLQISVTDNGQGNDESTLRDGNGIRNMRTRASESGFFISITSNKEGHSILLTS